MNLLYNIILQEKEKKMNSKKKWTAIATASLALILAVVFTVEARPFGRGGKGGDGGFGYHGKGMKSEMRGLRHLIDLTDEQRDRIEKIRTDHREQMRGLSDSFRSSRRDSMRALMDTDEFSADKARQVFQEGSAVREEMFVLRAQMRYDIKEVLTPEQIETLKEERAQGPGRRHRY